MHAAFTADEILYATSSHLKSGYIDESKGNVVWDIDDLKAGQEPFLKMLIFREEFFCIHTNTATIAI